MVYSNEKSNGVLEVPSGDHGLKQGINDTSKEEKSWEHPWTTNEIRKNSSNWTLAGDVGLLNHLKQFSHTLISRTHEMEKVVDDLVHKSKVACVKVSNVINDFQMLSNLQFVENRVYDEEAKDTEPIQIHDQPKTKEQREAEMVPRIVQALELGVSVLDKAFERIEVEETSESEDEEDISQGRTILEPKDLYEHRPLPFIIGSKEFQNDDHAGLHNLYEEDVSTDISTQDENISASAESEDESEESDYEPAPPPRPTIITEHKDTKSSVDTLQNNYSESEGSDLFDAEEEEGENINDYLPVKAAVEKPKPKLDAKTSLMEELKKKTAPSTVANENPKPESIQSEIRTEIMEKKDSEDLFASGDSFMENEDSPFRKKTGLFSAAGSGLFDSQEEEKLSNSLFDDDEVPPPITKEVPKLQEKKIVPQKKKQETLVPKSAKPTNFFDDDDDDSEHDLFASISTSTPPLNKKASAKVANTSATSTPIQSKKEKKPAGLLEETASSNSLFGDDSDENDLFSSVNKGNRITSSFDSLTKEEDDEDDLFSTRPLKSGKTESKLLDSDLVTQTPQKNKLPSLFEDSDSFDLFKPSVEEEHPKMDALNSKKPVKSDDIKTKEAKPSSLFEESDNFSDSKLLIKTNEPKAKEIKATSLFEESDSFFDSDQHIKPVESKVKETRPSSSSLFEESESFTDSKQQVKPIQTKIKEIRTSSSSSLFEESDGDSKLLVKPSPPKVKETKPSSLFEESDSFDLFAPRKEMKKENTLPVKVRPAPQTQHQETTDSSSGFDQPISGSTTLSAINKDRVKIQAKRRKPTRRGRQMHISHNDELETADKSKATNVEALFTQKEAESDIFSSHEQLLKDTNSVTESTSGGPSPKKSTYKNSEQSKKNLMSQLISEAAISRIGKRNSAADIDNDEDEDDAVTDKDSSSKSVSSDFSLVSPTSVKPSDFAVRISGKTEATEHREISDVLSDSTSDDDLFSARPFSDFNSSTANKNSVFDDDDDDDIFKSLKNEDAKSQISGMSVTDADDDIFAGVDREKYEMFPTQSYNDDDDDDDDIFSNIGKPSKPAAEKLSTNNKKETAKGNTDIFTDPLGGLALND